MWPYFLISFFISVFIFYRIPRSFDEMPSVYPYLRYSLQDSGQKYSKIPELDNSNIFNVILSENNGSILLKRPFRSDLKLDAKEILAFAPVLGAGFLSYKKVGHEILFQSAENEVLWKKPFSSYPVTDHLGRIILLLTGDNNEVKLADMNGNPAGVFSVSGNYLSDYDFALENATVLLTFANGDTVLLSREGSLLSRFRLSNFLKVKDEETLFVKSGSVSSDGRTFALHYVLRERDFISVFTYDPERSEKVKKMHDIEFSQIYPHILHFAVESTGVLAAAPDRTLFFDENGNILFNQSVKGPNKIYRPVFSSKEIFACMDSNQVFVYDSNGQIVDSFSVGSPEEGPFRIVPGRKKGQFSVQSRNDMYFYSFTDGRS